MEPVAAQPTARVGECVIEAMQQLCPVIVEIDVKPRPRGVVKVGDVIGVSGFEPPSHGLLEQREVQCRDPRFAAASARARATASSSSKSPIGGILSSRSIITATGPARAITVSKRSQTLSQTG